MTDYFSAYLVWNIIFLCAWLLLYAARPRARHEMLVFSILAIPLGPIAVYFYSGDYFLPERILGSVFGIEDMINAFVNAGIAGSLFEFVRMDRGTTPERAGFWVYALAAYIGGTLFMLAGVWFGFNSVYVSFALFALVGISMVVARPRLLKNALWSGLLFCAVHTVFYLYFFAAYPETISWWRLENVSGVLPLGIPLEEYLWTFGWGFVAGLHQNLWLDLRCQNFFHTHSTFLKCKSGTVLAASLTS